jgi:N-carbamoylputrescine amidase
MKAAICQHQCINSDVAGNFSRLEQLCMKAQRAEAQAAFFPETAIMGWVNPEAHQLAEPIPGTFSEKIGTLAAKYKLMIGIGLCEKTDEGLYDSAILVDSSGHLLLKHRKINTLIHLLDPPYLRGTVEDISAVDTEFGTIGILICADSFIDEHLERMAQHQPDIVYIPYGWAYPKEGWPEHGFELLRTVQKSARTVGALVIGPNLVGEITHGPWEGQTYEGLSTAADANGMSLVQGKFGKEDLVILDVPALAK